ncbi:MAG: type II secretion system protein [Geobacteraceae bacterium]|nr:type II secretion system protein [Geobacteraceae bacterium]
MRPKGFTLVEVLFAILIMGILAAVSIPNYNAMKKKADIERQTREIYSTVVATRLSAMQNKQRSIIFFQPNSYQFKVYSSSAEPQTAGALRSSTALPFKLQKVDSTSGLIDFTASNNILEFDVNGVTTTNMTFAITPVIYNEGTNCIVVHAIRTNMGRMSSATDCKVK